MGVKPGPEYRAYMARARKVAKFSMQESHYIGARLKVLGYATLGEYYRSASWRRRRRRMIKDACERCGYDRKCALQVHHRTYRRLGCELKGDVETLCRRCHETEHGITRKPRRRRRKR